MGRVAVGSAERFPGGRLAEDSLKRAEAEGKSENVIFCCVTFLAKCFIAWWMEVFQTDGDEQCSVS